MIMKILMKAICVVLIVGSLPGSVLASLTILVQPDKATYAPGEKASMSVFAYSTVNLTSPTYLQAFQLAFDLTPVSGKGYNQTFFLNESGNFLGSNGIYNPSTTPFASNQTDFSNFDFLMRGERVTNNTDNDLLGKNATNAIKLATVTFDISASTTAGSYSLVFKPLALYTSNDLENDPVNIITIFDGTTNALSELQITMSSAGGNFVVAGEAIPEPTTITLLAIGLAGGVACRRFRKRSSSVGPGTTDPSTNGAKV